MRDLTNQRFGRLIAIKPTKERVDSKVVWLCKCDCGKEHKAVSRNLVTGDTRSCGCWKEEWLSKCPTKLKKGEAAFNQLYGNYKRQAKIRKYVFNLSKEEFFDLTKQNCSYCGAKPYQKAKGKHLNGVYTYNGVDRLNNNLGYTVENCVACCGICNRAKDTMSTKEFIDWISRVYSNLN